jgi:hypothetical protein
MRRLILAFLFTAAACGGSLKYSIDDNVMAGVPAQEREPINLARTDAMRAEDTLREAQRTEQNAKNELDTAENEYKQSKLSRDSAKVNRTSAEQSGDFNRKNKAEIEFNVAEKATEEADAKVDWLSKKKKWATTMREAAEEAVAGGKSKIELEKARICAQKNIRPSEKFNVLEFEQQALEKQTKYNDRRRDADELKVKVDDLERKYLAKKQTTETAKMSIPH